MASSRTYDKRSLGSLITRMKAMKGTELSVGFFEEDQYGADNENLPVAQVAWYNERGVGREIPSRPFMETTFTEAKNIRAFAQGVEDVFTDVLDKGRLTKRKLADLGTKIQDIMQQTIADWSTPPNSQWWANIKGKNDPLVFTEKMLKSVKYKVEKS